MESPLLPEKQVLFNPKLFKSLESVSTWDGAGMGNRCVGVEAHLLGSVGSAEVRWLGRERAAMAEDELPAILPSPREPDPTSNHETNTTSFSSINRHTFDGPSQGLGPHPASSAVIVRHSERVQESAVSGVPDGQARATRGIANWAQ